jgi:D-alanine transaminase
MSIIYLNGTFMNADQARISPTDRGFLFADGIYEVIPAFNGVLFRLSEHLDRLQRSLDALQIVNPHSGGVWRELFSEMVARNGRRNISVYLQITRGAPEKRDHGFPLSPLPPTVYMATSPLTPSAIHDVNGHPGASAIVANDIRWARCDIKAVALLPNIMLRQQAIDKGAAEAILIRDGFVTEGSSTNVFVVKAGRVATPPCTHKILAGITRNVVVELCHSHALPLAEQDISSEQLYDADEIWLTSSSKDVLPIVTLSDRPVGNGRPGPLWKELALHFVEFKQTLCGNVWA